MRGYLDKYFGLISFIVFITFFINFYFVLSNKIEESTLIKFSDIPKGYFVKIDTKRFFIYKDKNYLIIYNNSLLIKSNYSFYLPYFCNYLKCIPESVNGSYYILKLILLK